MVHPHQPKFKEYKYKPQWQPIVVPVNGPVDRSFMTGAVILNPKDMNNIVRTNLERFISRNTRITVVFSLSPGLPRFAAPSVLSTDKMFRKPKS